MSTEIDPRSINPDAIDVNPEADDRDVFATHEERVRSERTAALLAELDEFAAGRPDEEVPQGEGDQGDQSEESTLQAVARNLSPREAFGGALDALDENFNTLRLLSESGNEFLMDKLGIPGLIIDEDGGFRLTTDSGELSETDDLGGLLPDVGNKERGGLARALGQFAANYVALGKVFKGLNILQGSGYAVLAANQGLRSGIATASGFEGMDNPVNHLVDAFPSLEGPVSEFLDSDVEDPELLNKLRTGLLDVGVGGAIDTTMGMIRGVRSLGKTVRPVAEAASQIDEAIKQMDQTKQMFKDILGDPDSAEMFIRNTDTAVREGAEAAAGDADEVFINWARIDTPDDVKELIQEMANADAPKINAARRGVQSQTQTQMLADQEDAWKILTERRASNTPMPLNAEQSLAVRRLWTSSGEKVMELAQRVRAGGGVVDKVAFRKMLSVHAAIQEQVIAARTETARALAQWKIPAGGLADFSVGFDDMMKQTDLDSSTSKMAESVSSLMAMGDTRAVDKYVYGAGRLGTIQKIGAHASDMLVQLYYGSMLSGPHTHARNMIGNSAEIGLRVMERKVASAIGRSFDDVQVPEGEASALIFGHLQGARDAFRLSAKSQAAAVAEGRVPGGVWQALKTGDSGFGIGKVDAGMVGAFSPEKLGVNPDTVWGKALKVLDTATQTPTRGLNAEDEFFKTANYRGELMAQAHRKATEELSNGTITREMFADRVTRLANEPDEVMKLAAVRQAQEATFTRQPENTQVWKAMRAVSRVPFLGKLVLPFSRTPYNIMVESIERLPLAPLSKKWRDDLLAGGARADIALAKTGLGSMFLMSAFDLAANGFITGDMAKYSGAERQTRGRLGERSMTVRVPLGENDEVRTFSFRGLDPLTFSLGIAGNLFEILSDDDFEDEDKDFQDVAAAAVLAIGAQFSSANYMSGVSSFFDAMSDPKRYGENYFERLVSVVAPQGVAQVSRAMDPTMREVGTWWEAVLAKTPASDRLEPKMDIFARELERSSGLGAAYDFMVPVYSSKQDVLPIDKEMERLGIAVGRPGKSTSYDGIQFNFKKFPKAYTAYQRLAGNEMKATVDGSPIVVGSIGYVSMGGGLKEELNAIVQGEHPFSAMYELGTDGRDGDKANFIKRIISEYRAEAKRHVVEDFPELKAELQSRFGERQERNFGSQTLSVFGS